MAPTTKKWIDKKSATTFAVRYRSQKDPLIHDETANDFVLTEVEAPNSNKPSSSKPDKSKTVRDLEAELGLDASKIRANEGEAAMYGVYFDDTKYDYMQHLRDMGGSSEAVFIEAPQAESKQRKGKGKKLEDVLRDEKLEPKSTVIKLPKELLPSEVEMKRTYQDQQDVQDAISGFKPDMDPRLREVLEALEDDAYVDDDEDLFGQLAKAGEAKSLDEVEEFDEDEDDGWGSDTTEKPAKTQRNADSESEDWMREFSKFKKSQKKAKNDDDVSSFADTMSFGGTSAITGETTMSVSKRRRRREKKSGVTESSGYSMSSSALFRTEGLTLLDDRFDRIEEEYNEGSEEDDGPRGPVPETRKDFDNILDEFLEGYNMVGSAPKRHRVRRGKQMTGMEQLDEIRRGLGKARITT